LSFNPIGEQAIRELAKIDNPTIIHAKKTSAGVFGKDASEQRRLRRLSWHPYK
jgi:hypothetical protein